MRTLSFAKTLSAFAVTACLAAGATAKPLARSLDEFGDISTAAGAAKALEAGIKELLAAGGGVLVIPADAPKESWPTTSRRHASTSQR